jgi:hypothetical protein
MTGSNDFGSDVLLLDWHKLTPDEINERIDWLRHSLDAGTDWGYCEELLTCALKTTAASMLYKLRWFESEGQKLIDRPAMMLSTRAGIASMFGDE